MSAWEASTCHDWPVEKAIVDLPVRLKENSKRVSGNSSSPLGAQNKDYGASSETLLTRLSYVCDEGDESSHVTSL